jgi:predicted O-linked N-acetylglucosamine transferase (SPINDLY family)
MNDADMFLCPFPFGNTNGIVDAMTVGLPGVCKTGVDVFEHIDGAMFARVGMPSWVTAETVDEYIEAAMRMISGHAEREALRERLIRDKVVQRFFDGRLEAFGERVLQVLQEKQRATDQA